MKRIFCLSFDFLLFWTWKPKNIARISKYRKWISRDINSIICNLNGWKLAHSLNPEGLQNDRPELKWYVLATKYLKNSTNWKSMYIRNTICAHLTQWKYRNTFRRCYKLKTIVNRTFEILNAKWRLNIPHNRNYSRIECTECSHIVIKWRHPKLAHIELLGTNSIRIHWIITIK